MRSRSWLGLLTALIPVTGARAQGLIAITHVTVIDGADSTGRPDQTVIVRDGRIVEVGPSHSVPVPGGARLVGGRTKYLIPGLWDMHVHTDVPGGRAVLPLYVANGVTGVRDLGGGWEVIQALRAEVRSGRLIGPRIVAAGPYLDGNDQPIAHLRVRTPEEAITAVDSLARLGVDLVKLHTGLGREGFFAALRRARERGLPTAGHVPRVVSAIEASDSGIGSIEHLLSIPVPCTPAESLALRPRYTVQAALGRCAGGDLSVLFARLAKNGTRVTPTFTAQYEVARWPKRSVPGDAFAGYLPDTLRRYVAAIFPMPDSIPPGADRAGRGMFEKRLREAGAMFRAGVEVLAGTDAPLRNSPPGFGLHQELAWLVRAGLTPFQVLRLATLGAARFLGVADSLGTIAPGKLADLVLLDGDPRRDISNTRRIRAVVANGRYFEPIDLLRNR